MILNSRIVGPLKLIMKQLIVTVAVFILLMAVIIQIPLELLNYERRQAVMFYVNNAKERAKQEGCYTEAILNKLKKDINDNKKLGLKISDEDIEATRESDIKYRLDKFKEGELIKLKINIPIDRIVAASAFFGLNNSKGYYTIEVVTTSEKLK